jgi:hypothetical protein
LPEARDVLPLGRETVPALADVVRPAAAPTGRLVRVLLADHPAPGVIDMTETAALTQEERAEIRALAGPLHDTARQINRAINDAPAEVDGGHAAVCQSAADALPRLLDALEAAERERDEARRMLSPGE